jgi:predicted adenine nucleotide alpha hydrolase (AANH) superfamily ATPase
MLVEIENLPKNSRVLLHTCCSACLASSLDFFINRNSLPSIFYFNPNIHPYNEYLKRRESLLAWLKLYHPESNFIEGLYDLKDYFQAVSGSENYPERCRFCYRIRLHETAKIALELGYNYFSTTLFASPYQQHKVVLEESLRAAETFDLSVVHFIMDKKDYRKKIETYKNNGLYYQSYCGCLFSEFERYSNFKR